MPSSLPGVVVFLALLAPGFLYVLLDEGQRPQPKVSVFRETVRVVVASVGAFSIALLVFAVVRWTWPWLTIDVRRFLKQPNAYVQNNHERFFVAALALVAIAMSVAYLVGRFCGPLLQKVISADLVDESSWMHAFELEKGLEERGYVAVATCYLTSGQTVRGVVESYAVDPIETQDRGLVLLAPLVVGDLASPTLLPAGRAVLTGHDIDWIHVEYALPDSVDMTVKTDLPSIEVSTDDAIPVDPSEQLGAEESSPGMPPRPAT